MVFDSREKVATMKETVATDEERFAKVAGNNWLDPMCTPVGTR